MAYELVPRSGKTHSAAEVAESLAKEFAFVVVDEAAGHAAALRLADWIEKANPAIFLGRHEEALSNALRLRNLTSGEAVVLKFGDTPEHLSSITVLPNER